MRLTVNDELADQYLQALPTRGILEDTMNRVLVRGLPLVDEGAVVLTKDEASQLAHVLNRPQLGTGREIISQAQTLADLKIGQVRLKLPSSVLAGLKARAEREGKPLSELMQWAIEELSQNLARFA